MENIEEIEQLYREMYELLYAYAYSALHNHALAEEAVQETFRIACVREIEMVSSPNSRGWLKNTLKYVVNNMWRKNANINRLISDVIINKEPSARDEIDIDILYSNIAGSKDYKLLRRIAIDHYTIVELATELGISVEACKKRVQRARKRLQKRLDQK